MTRRVDDVPRHRGLHLLDWQLRRDRARAVRQEPTMDATTYAMTPAGRRQLRGIPCVGTGGLDERRNPLLEVLDRERDARSRPVVGCPACSGTGVRRKEPTDG